MTVFKLHLLGRTQEEIGDVVVMRFSADLPKNAKPQAEHLTDFEPPIYNVWKQQKKSKGPKHFGNSEVRRLPMMLESLELLLKRF